MLRPHGTGDTTQDLRMLSQVPQGTHDRKCSRKRKTRPKGKPRTQFCCNSAFSTRTGTTDSGSKAGRCPAGEFAQKTQSCTCDPQGPLAGVPRAAQKRTWALWPHRAPPFLHCPPSLFFSEALAGVFACVLLLMMPTGRRPPAHRQAGDYHTYWTSSAHTAGLIHLFIHSFIH